MILRHLLPERSLYIASGSDVAGVRCDPHGIRLELPGLGAGTGDAELGQHAELGSVEPGSGKLVGGTCAWLPDHFDGPGCHFARRRLAGNDWSP